MICPHCSSILVIQSNEISFDVDEIENHPEVLYDGIIKTKGCWFKLTEYRCYSCGDYFWLED